MSNTFDDLFELMSGFKQWLWLQTWLYFHWNDYLHEGT